MKKSKLYNVRRKCQVIAQRLTTYEFMSKVYFRIVLKKKLNLKNPKSLNEKLQWLKLNEWPYNEDAIKCADKYRVREYIEKKNLGEYLNDLLFVWDRAEDIDFDALPKSFVLKCNHGCGYNIICPDKDLLDVKETREKLKKWMDEDFGHFNAEPHYSKIKRKIICEKYLGGDINNYNIFCLNGEPQFISVIKGLGAGTDESLTYYYANGEVAPFKSEAYPINDEALPSCIEKMKEIARELAKEFPFLRADFYHVDGKILLSEMTFTPGGCLIPFSPDKYDAELGKLLDITDLMKGRK